MQLEAIQAGLAALGKVATAQDLGSSRSRLHAEISEVCIAILRLLCSDFAQSPQPPVKRVRQATS